VDAIEVAKSEECRGFALIGSEESFVGILKAECGEEREERTVVATRELVGWGRETWSAVGVSARKGSTTQEAQEMESRCQSRLIVGPAA
jgi:hypothetical protein